jgi:hypothetical protein
MERVVVESNHWPGFSWISKSRGCGKSSGFYARQVKAPGLTYFLDDGKFIPFVQPRRLPGLRYVIPEVKKKRCSR